MLRWPGIKRLKILSVWFWNIASVAWDFTLCKSHPRGEHTDNTFAVDVCLSFGILVMPFHVCQVSVRGLSFQLKTFVVGRMVSRRKAWVTKLHGICENRILLRIADLTETHLLLSWESLFSGNNLCRLTCLQHDLLCDRYERHSECKPPAVLPSWASRFRCWNYVVFPVPGGPCGCLRIRHTETHSLDALHCWPHSWYCCRYCMRA